MSGMEMQILCSNAVVLGSVLRTAMEAVVAETAIVAAKSIAWSLWMMGTMPNGRDLLCKESNTLGRFPFAEIHEVKKPGPENKDGSDTEDDEEDEDEDEDDEEAEDQDDDRGEEEDGSGEEGGEDNGDPEDEPEANGDGASGDEDDEEEDDDDDDGEEEEDDEEEEPEDEEETPQPPAKKRK